MLLTRKASPDRHLFITENHLTLVQAVEEKEQRFVYKSELTVGNINTSIKLL